MPEAIDTGSLWGLFGLVVFSLLSVIFLFPRLITLVFTLFSLTKIKEAYQTIVRPYYSRLGLICILIVLDLALLTVAKIIWFRYLEIVVGIVLVILVSWLGCNIFKDIFDTYLLDSIVQSRGRFNSELLIVSKSLVNIAIVFVVIFIFAQVHHVNLVGLFASLGISGLAIAFAAQKTLEQILGGVVLYLDRPFFVNDYIGLADGTFGKVESIGLRSTRIRTSGKGTVVIIPNSSLTQVNIENYTGAKKVISLINITFEQIIPESEKAFIRQIIINSTNNIYGIDFRNTEVIFKEITNERGNKATKVQINFIVLGSGKVSLELRQQLLDIAKQKLNKELKKYGIGFVLEDKTINIDSPITI
ncbi:MAG: mechanosensitive ion channel domain-containing protein [Cyanobacteria bacterium P01_G01_bin.39]